MKIVVMRYEGWFTSYQSAKRVWGGEVEYTQHLHNRYLKVYRLFGKYMLWSTVVAIEEVPIWAWAQCATGGSTEFVDEFRKNNPEYAKKFDDRVEEVVYAI